MLLVLAGTDAALTLARDAVGGEFDGDLIYFKAYPYIHTAACVCVSCTSCSDLPVFIVETHDSNNVR